MLSDREVRQNRKTFSEIDKSLVAAFKVLSDVNRYRIFRILAEQPQLTISDVAQILSISLPLTSQHIKVLEQAKFIQKERGGKKVFPKIARGNKFVQAVIKTTKLVVK